MDIQFIVYTDNRHQHFIFLQNAFCKNFFHTNNFVNILFQMTLVSKVMTKKLLKTQFHQISDYIATEIYSKVYVFVRTLFLNKTFSKLISILRLTKYLTFTILTTCCPICIFHLSATQMQ